MKIRPFYKLDSLGIKEYDYLSNTTEANKEEVRDWIINELIESYRYPLNWVNERIIPVENDTFYGLHVLTNEKYPYLLISVEQPGGAEIAERNIKNEFNKYPYTALGIISDGTLKGTNVVRRRVDSDKLEYTVDIQSYQSNRIDVIHNYSIIENNTTNKKQSLLSEKLESVFFEAHSHLRDIDGLHADEALDELCKIIYCKLFDETNSYEESPKMQRALYNSTEELAVSIKLLYRSALEKSLNGNNDNDEYIGVFKNEIKLSSAALLKVVNVLEGYNIINSDIDIKGRAFQKVLNPAMRAGMGQYFTPLPIIQLMVQITKPTINEYILDPFCGSGHFLSTSFDYVRDSLNIDKENIEEVMKNFAVNRLHGIEKSERMVRIAMTDMMLHGDGSTHISCLDSLLDFSNYTNLKSELFDLILTNPPFGSILGKEAIMQLGYFHLSEGHKNIPLEVLGFERCIQFLRPGGRLGIVLPDGLLANKRAEYVRDWIEDQGKIRAIISLPNETFTPFGANIKTSVVLLRKWEVGEQKEEDYNIFLASINNIGYDAVGRLRTDSELDEIIRAANDFFEKEGW